MEILLWIGILVVTTAVFIFYMFHVRFQENAEWYDDWREPGNLWIMPYWTPMVIFVALGELYELSGYWGGVVVFNLLRVVAIIALLMGLIGLLGLLGIPLPWPFVPRWVVERRKKDRAERKARRRRRKEGG
ncbi:hypothetical protein [Auritidibacter sp. NML100628]|uniref:hypothetical protein n=1 Tax=Auritidibacter sp. NML100628 TaxID=2170742 RepID=UPI000D72D3BB|nr:hypothetical protein [Auritidibacter sp. NML100628]PXA76243.1 hypothetical protein DCC24_07825 [Auritidibacter sp. NML100628]